MMRAKGLFGRLVDSAVLLSPLVALGMVFGVFEWNAASHGLLAAAGVLLAACFVMPRGSNMLNCYFARFIAWPSERLADVLLALYYLILLPIGIVLRMRQRLAEAPAPGSYWRKP
jgi:hypothetical protein